MALVGQKSVFKDIFMKKYNKLILLINLFFCIHFSLYAADTSKVDTEKLKSWIVAVNNEIKSLKARIKALEDEIAVLNQSNNNNTSSSNNRYKDENNQEKLTDSKKESKKIESLNPSKVTEYKGSVEFNLNGSWSQLKENIKFENNTGFKTSADSSVSIQMYRDNKIKVYSSSECLIKSPEYDNSNEEIEKQVVKLTKGEITAAVSIEGRKILHIEVSNITIVAQSGIFKVIYNENEDKGEVVVKNGLIDVKKNDSTSKLIKLSGFYKVTFEKGTISNPVQASVIQYDWK